MAGIGGSYLGARAVTKVSVILFAWFKLTRKTPPYSCRKQHRLSLMSLPLIFARVIIFCRNRPLASSAQEAVTKSATSCLTSNPATAIGRRPTGVSTEKRPPTLSGMMKLLYPSLSAHVRAAPFLASVTATMTSLASSLPRWSSTLLLEQTESESGLSGSTRLRDVDHTELLVLKISGKLIEIVLADVVSGKEYGGVFLVSNKPSEKNYRDLRLRRVHRDSCRRYQPQPLPRTSHAAS